MNFITCYLQGGLGNQLFIIFTTIATAIKNKCKFVIINQQDSPSITPRKTYFDTLLSKIPTETRYTESISQIFRENDHMKYEHIPHFTSNTMIHGYFQSRKYIDDIRSEIVNFISLNDKDSKMLDISLKIIKEKANNRKLIFIHVRRGDYLNLSNYHYNIPIEYYLDAIKKHQKKYDCYFVVFSDDIGYCKDEFSNHLTKDEVFYSKISKDYVELMLMSEMDGAIIANSSFSWWGAYLMEAKKEFSGKESPFVIGPKMWFTGITDSNDRNVERSNWEFL